MRNLIEKIVIMLLAVMNLLFTIVGLFSEFWIFILFLFEFIGSCIAIILIRNKDKTENWDKVLENNKQKDYRQKKLKLDQERALLNRECTSIEQERASLKRERASIEQERASLKRERASLKRYKEEAEENFKTKINENQEITEKQRKDIKNKKKELDRINNEIESKNEELKLKKKQIKSFTNSMKNMKEKSSNTSEFPNNKPNKDKIIKININKADVDEIKTLPNINLIQAKKIIQMREDGNYIKSFDDLADKLNLSSYQITVLKDYIIIDNPVFKVNGRFIDI